MSDFEDTLWCAGCGTEIIFSPFMTNNQVFCCQDCALEIKCNCGRAMEREDDYRDATASIESIYPGI